MCFTWYRRDCARYTVSHGALNEYATTKVLQKKYGKRGNGLGKSGVRCHKKANREGKLLV